MKISPSIVPILVAVSSGFAAGWLCKSLPTLLAGSGKTSAQSRSEFKPTPEFVASSARFQGLSPSSAFSGNTIEAHFATELKSLKRLSDTEFASRMVDTWLAREDPDNLLSRALFSEACDSGKAMAFYDEFKRRKGISNQDDAGPALWNFMFAAGKRYGAELVQKLTETNPQGILEIDTIVHGWVTVESTQAVEWLNSLPEDCPFYSKSLKGIVWGIGETSPDFAADTFLKLPTEERNQKFESLAGGVINGHGIAGLSKIVSHLPEEKDRANLLLSSLPFAMEKPPADFINGMAKYLSSVPDLSRPMQIMAERWVKTSPNDAIAWLDKNADNADQAAALGVMASQLSQRGHRDAVVAWLAAHPQSPGRAAVEAWR
ncbi:MAG: hypothetical protein V4640_08550 [Verrucomicrobiota bacterium]